MKSLADKHLHIVSFDIPYPPGYGGVIDVFYRLKALSAAGIRISLHAFYKGAALEVPELEKYCDNVFLYPRRMNWTKAMGTTPFIIASRNDEELIQNLATGNSPILLEGMHTLSVAGHPALRKRMIALRMHNIEWNYYRALFKQEERYMKKLYFGVEAFRLRRAARLLKNVSLILAISEREREELSGQFSNCNYLPPFHGNQGVDISEGRGNYALYHGNLSVPENRKAVEFLTVEVFNRLDLPLKVAGSNAPREWVEKWLRADNERLEFIPSPDERTLSGLIRNAQMNVLASFQDTGVKLKLINALYKGRHCIVNRQMVSGSVLEKLCRVAGDAAHYRELVREYETVPFTKEDVEARKSVLDAEFNDSKNVERLIGWIYSPR